MRIDVEVVNGDRYELDVPPGATYGDILRHVDVGIHEGTVLVDGRPVPTDAPVEAGAVAVLRLVSGG